MAPWAPNVDADTVCGDPLATGPRDQAEVGAWPHHGLPGLRQTTFEGPFLFPLKRKIRNSNRILIGFFDFRILFGPKWSK